MLTKLLFEPDAYIHWLDRITAGIDRSGQQQSRRATEYGVAEIISPW